MVPLKDCPTNPSILLTDQVISVDGTLLLRTSRGPSGELPQGLGVGVGDEEFLSSPLAFFAEAPAEGPLFLALVTGLVIIDCL